MGFGVSKCICAEVGSDKEALDGGEQKRSKFGFSPHKKHTPSMSKVERGGCPAAHLSLLTTSHAIPHLCTPPHFTILPHILVFTNSTWLLSATSSTILHFALSSPPHIHPVLDSTLSTSYFNPPTPVTFHGIQSSLSTPVLMLCKSFGLNYLPPQVTAAAS